MKTMVTLFALCAATAGALVLSAGVSRAQLLITGARAPRPSTSNVETLQGTVSFDDIEELSALPDFEQAICGPCRSPSSADATW